MSESPLQKTSAARYESLAMDRQPFLDRAREASKLTIPSLIPPEGMNSTTNLYKPYQSLGSRGVTNLSSKLLLAIFPPNTPFSRFKISDFELERAASEDKDFKSNLDEGLAKIERGIQDDIETSGVRADAPELFNHYIVAGNVLVHQPVNEGLRIFPLDQYVVVRDREGNEVEILVKETIALQALPEKYQKYCVQVHQKENPGDTSELNEVDLFTHLKLIKGHWEGHQEIKGQIIEETRGTYPKDSFPWQALRWAKVAGEDYGRGLIENLQGDLQSLEGLTQAIVEGSAASAKVIFLVNPNGSTSAATLAKTRNGGFAVGNENDVTTVKVDKGSDFRVALETSQGIEKRLEKAFLLNSSVQRSGERVTAEEIRYLANELESAHAGVYALLAKDFQLRLVKVKIAQLTKQGKIPKLPKSIRPMIVTGIEALGRNSDLNKLDQFISEMGQLVGPDEVKRRVNTGELFKRRATALGIELKGLVKTDEEVAQDDQQAQQQAMMQQAASPLINSLGGMAKENIKSSNQAPVEPAA